ncbi:MAG: PadR family transcriptional regulator [Pleurocapsa minor HA4230-MV1]|jgi:DNA-binding PadR family transcriptional regulator|nr:PadR family transcriptional regulator [Pleurocapsa minor HA4230-MV1]
MLELAALGLLLKKPLHGYLLKQQLERFMSGCISVNYGAIYPLLKRLEKQKYIKTQALTDAGSNRKVYQITELGRDRWREKMLAHPHESWVNSRSRFIIKFFFFSQLEPTERVKLMQSRLMTCQLRLENRESQIVEQAEDPYRAIALQRHLANLRCEIEWLKKQILREENNTISNNLG